MFLNFFFCFLHSVQVMFYRVFPPFTWIYPVLFLLRNFKDLFTTVLILQLKLLTIPQEIWPKIAWLFSINIFMTNRCHENVEIYLQCIQTLIFHLNSFIYYASMSFFQFWRVNYISNHWDNELKYPEYLWCNDLIEKITYWFPS